MSGPFFPPPPKAEPPYRRAAAPGLDAPAEKKSATVVSRPEPPKEPKKREATPPKGRTAEASGIARPRSSGPSATNPLIHLLVRWPRLTGLVLAVIFGASFVGGVDSLNQLRETGRAYVYRPGVMNLFAALTAASLWFAIFGIGWDDERDALKSWWLLGLASAAIAAAGLKSDIVAMVQSLL